MADNKQKKTQDDFTNLILGIEPPIVPASSKNSSSTKDEGGSTRVLEDKNDKTENLQLVKDLPAKDSPSRDAKDNEVINKFSKTTLGTPNKQNAQPFQFDPSMVSVEAALKQAELLKLAHKKNEELEKRISEISQENETLAASAVVLQRKNEQLIQKNEDLKADLKGKVDLAKSETDDKSKQYIELKREFDKLQKKYEEVSTLMNEKFQQSRRREKELSNRLEILQSGGDAVITTKDEKILQLKKEIDRLGFEVENYKTQIFDLQSKIQAIKEQSRRSLKALRLASSLLEADENDPLKKTGT